MNYDVQYNQKVCYNGHCPLEVVMNTDEIIHRNPRTGVGHVAAREGGGIFLATNIFLNLHKEKGILQKLPLTYLETCEKLKGN